MILFGDFFISLFFLETFSISVGHGDSSLLRVKPVSQKTDVFVCDSEWTMNEANVACKHLGFEL